MHIFWGRAEYLEHLMVCSTSKAKQQPRGYHLINFAIVAELLKFIVTYKLPEKFSFKPFDYFYDQKIYIIRRANARIVSFSSLYGGQFTLSTKLLTSNYPVMAPRPRQHQSFFRNLPPFIRFPDFVCWFPRVARGTVWIKCFAKDHNALTWPRIDHMVNLYFGRCLYFS